MIGLHESRFSESDIEAVVSTLKSGWVSSSGPDVGDFEQKFADYVNASSALAVSSGTVGLFLLIESLRRAKNYKPGESDVIVPNLTFIATPNSAFHAGCRPIPVDCESEKLHPSGDQIFRLISSKYDFNPKDRVWYEKKSKRPLLAIMIAHLMGSAMERRCIDMLNEETGVPVCEDAAEALGCKYSDGRHVGTLGYAGVYSFNGNKLLTTGGGGMIVSNNTEAISGLKHLSTTAKKDSMRFIHDEIAYNFRMVNLLSVLGISQLCRIEETIDKKKRVYEAYNQFLAEIKSVRLLENNSELRSNYWLNNVIFENETVRDKALNELNNQGFQSRPLWTPIHMQPAYSCAINEKDLSNSEWVWKRTLSLPSSAHLEINQVKRICEIIHSVVDTTR
ncbi:MAG: DegT/DnrJ/EryC1/StrS family aminotransferase [Oligoflexales bacterium]